MEITPKYEILSIKGIWMLNKEEISNNLIESSQNTGEGSYTTCPVLCHCVAPNLVKMDFPCSSFHISCKYTTRTFIFLVSRDKIQISKPRLVVLENTRYLQPERCDSSRGEISLLLTLQPTCEYTLVTSPNFLDQVSKFSLIICSIHAIQVNSCPTKKRRESIKFKNYLSPVPKANISPWIHLPQYFIQVKQESTFFVTMRIPNDSPVTQIGYYFFPSDPNCPQLKRLYLNPKEKENYYPATHFNDAFFLHNQNPKVDLKHNQDTFQLPAKSQWILIPRAQPTPNQETKFELEFEWEGSIVALELSSRWKQLKIQGEWCLNTAGGCYLHTSWLDNRQYQITFYQSATVTVVCSLIDEDVSFPIGCYIVQNHGPLKKCLTIDSQNLVQPVLFSTQKNHFQNFTGQAGKTYNLIPCSYEPEHTARYQLTVYFEHEACLTFTEVEKYYTQFIVEGKWRANLPAGSMRYPTWRCNPQYNLEVEKTQPIKMGVVLTQTPNYSTDGGPVDNSVTNASSGYSSSTSGVGDISLSKKKWLSRIDLSLAETSNGMEFIGFYLFPTEDAHYKRILVSQKELLLQPCFVSERELIAYYLDFFQSPSPSFTIVPATLYPTLDHDLKFELRVFMETQEPCVLKYTIEKIKGERNTLKWHCSLNDTDIQSTQNSVIDQGYMVKSYNFSVDNNATRCIILLLQDHLSLSRIQLHRLTFHSSHSSLNSSTIFSNLSGSISSPPPEQKKCEFTIGDSSSLKHRILVAQNDFSRVTESNLVFDLQSGIYQITISIANSGCSGYFSVILHSYGPVIDLSARTLHSETPNSVSKRKLVIEEILTTEKSYIKGLSVLADHFMNNMLLACRSSISQMDAIKGIFSNIPTILNCNQAFYGQLKHVVQSPEPTIGKIFFEFSNFFRMYAEYTNNFDQNLSALEEVKRKPAFKKILDKLESHPIVNHLTINDYYIMPVQRIPRYALLLEKLLKYTPDTHIDAANLRESLQKIKSIATEINERKRKAEAVAKVLDIQQILYDRSSKQPLLIAIPSRFFVRSGKMHYCVLEGVIAENEISKLEQTTNGEINVIQVSGITHTISLICTCYLFNDLFLVTKPKGRKLELRNEMAITGDIIVESQANDIFSVRVPSVRPCTMLFKTETPEEKEMWFSDFHALIQVIMDKQINKMRNVVKPPLKDSNLQALLNS